MRTLQRITIILFAAVLAVFCGVKIYTRLYLDRSAPVISLDSDTISVSVSDPREKLLEGVSAYDDRDGDLTGSVMIKSVTQLITGNTAKVNYIVFDSSNNMAMASRNVRYTDYEKPRFALEKPLVFAVGSKVTLTDRLTASDVIDGDISDAIRITSQNVAVNYEGVYSITVQVTNSMGDSETVTLKTTVNNSSYARRLVTLSEYITYVEAGTEFDPASYIRNVRAPGGDPLTEDNVEIVSNVDTSVPGYYEAAYTCSSQGETFTAYLAVIVR